MQSRTMIIGALSALVAGALIYAGGLSAQVRTGSKQAAKADDFWTTDFDKGLAAAKQQKKPVIMDFYTEWCGWCKKLDKETYGAPDIKKRLKEGWIGVKVNPEDASKKGTWGGKVMSYAEIAHEFDVRGYPTIIFLDKELKPVDLHATINFIPSEPFGPLLDYVKQELYTKNVLLETYMKDHMKK